MNYIGEAISLSVAMLWTASALSSEFATKRAGVLQINMIRLSVSVVLLCATLWFATGLPYPSFASLQAWAWLALSGLVGYIMGDYCLFNSFIIIGSRFSQLLMTLAPMVAALSGWAILGERLAPRHLLAMAITISGIALSILSRQGDNNKIGLKLPLKGVLLAIGAGIGQGLGLVLSKIGMNHYAMSVPDSQQAVAEMIPFAATLIRAIVGSLGFSLALYLRRDFGKLATTLKDKKTMGATLLSTITGPFIGVSLSLLAVKYTQAGIASTLMAMSTIFIILPSYLFFGQKITALEVVGTVISVFGVSLFFIS